MRRMVAGLSLLLIALAAAAKTNPGAAGKPNPKLRTQADSYARSMMQFIEFIEVRYVRPVERAALIEAAIAGLHEAVREPLPSGLRNDLARARTDSEYRHLLASVREQLGDRDELRDLRAVLAGIKAVARVLDPYCGIPSATEVRRSQSDPNVGIGVELDVANEGQLGNLEFDLPSTPAITQRGPYRIANVLPGGAAQRAGLRPGDLITHVSGQATDSDQGPTLIRRLHTYGSEGRSGELEIQIKRGERGEPMTLRVTPGPHTVEWVFGARRRRDNSWNYMLDGGRRIAYIRIGFIDNLAPAQLAEALQEVTAARIKGLILDLRDCPGGFVDPAVEIASMFVPSAGTIATVRDRGQQEQRFQASGRNVDLGGVPFIALVNGNTMGGGEMIAAALQDHQLAKICGQRTFGKGSVQRTQLISELAIQFKYTSGLFTRPNGKHLQRFPDSKPGDDWGIRPDSGYELPLPPDLHKQLKDWYTIYLLRPGSSREPLPLDDLENDPVRQLALRKIREQIP